MPTVAKHENGSFCWIELATTDQSAAKGFYTGLFGWDFVDSPMGPAELYTMFKLENKDVAAAYTLRQEQKDFGVPPHWSLYMLVASADDTAKRATELGATVLAAPFDVYTYGRMAVIKDPTGAVFSIWQANDHIGIGISGHHGSLCWADLSSPDPETAAKFYTQLFGWTVDPGDGSYLHIKNGNTYIGGIQSAAQRNPNAPPHWLIYYQVDSCDAATEKARQLGAKVWMEPMTLEKTGRFSIVADPQGAVFSLFQPA